MSYLGLYLQAALLLSLTAILCSLLLRVKMRFRLRFRFGSLQKLIYLLLMFSFAAPLVASYAPREALFRPAVQVWSGSEAVRNAPSSSVVRFAVETSQEEKSLALSDRAVWVGCALFLLGVLFAFGRFFRRYLALRELVLISPCIRSIGRIRILVSDQEASPWSARLPGVVAVVIPSALIAPTLLRKAALRHEFQHHRNGDTLMLYFFEALQALFFWNPAIAFLSNKARELQEFVCDENLVGRRIFSVQAYASCLVEAAQFAVQSRGVPACAAGMATSMNPGLGGSILRRRMLMLFEHQKSASVRSLVALASLSIGLVGSAAYAARSVIQDRTLSFSEAQAYARKASAEFEIPLEVNDLVLSKLNRYLGTSSGRKFLRNAYERLPNFRPMIERKARERGMPAELAAIALFESGLRNEVVSPAPYRAAGIWQFVAETARKYDLVVDSQLDERFNPEKETEAAIRYFADLHQMFGDWRLALKAYNEGESAVFSLIGKHRTRDPWVLERLSSRESYLSRAVAMLIIYGNPELVK